jgi:toxin ParE1/3/4
VSKKAELELDEIFVYWAKRAGVEVVDKLIDSIEDRFALLGDYPLIGKECDDFAPGVRSFPVGNYLVYYRKRRGIIQILRILYGARDQASALKTD